MAIAAETLNSITLEISAGPAGELIRTDIWYPGGRVEPEILGVAMSFSPPRFARLTVPAQVRWMRLACEPAGWRPGIYIAAGAGVLLGCALLAARLRRSVVRS